jgi:hypothetical protein
LQQFWFDEEALTVIETAIECNHIDGILCLAAPSVFERLRAKSRSCFLLDLDPRFVSHPLSRSFRNLHSQSPRIQIAFFSASECAQYSMLVDHFYDPDAETSLNVFMGKCRRLLIVCDPPFGVFISPLLSTLHKLQRRHAVAQEAVQ